VSKAKPANGPHEPTNALWLWAVWFFDLAMADSTWTRDRHAG
jgi:hypothetical protein